MKVLKHNPDDPDTSCQGCPLSVAGGSFCRLAPGDRTDREFRLPDWNPAPDWCPLRPENGGGVQVLAETGDE